MTSHHAWKIAFAAGLCAAVWPAGVEAATYNMSIQSVPAAGGKCVSAPTGQFVEGTHVLIWDCNSFMNQNLVYDDQTQELKFGANCVGILGQGSPEDPVGVGKCTGAVTQRWSMIAHGDSYQVLGANSLCLNITNGVVANGTPLNLETCVPNQAVELWTLLEATDPAAAAQAAAGSGAGASGQTPGQMASANPSGPGSGSGSGPGSGSSSDPSASGGPGGGGSGGGPSGGGPSGGGGSPGGGGSGPMSALPDPLTILAGLLNPPGSGWGDRPRGRDRDRNRNPNQPMDPNMGGAAPGPGRQPGPPMGANTPGATPGSGGMPGTGGLGPPPGPNTTPATPPAGGSPLPQNLCGLTANGQLVQVNISMPAPAPNQPTDTGQYCVSGGPRNGQCGTVTVDNAAGTAQLCGNGLCTPPMPPTPRGAYTQTLFGLPDSSPVVPCPMSTTASNDPLGGLGPPMMDQRTGQPGYRPRPVGMPMGSLPAAPPQIITLAVPVPPVGGTPNRPRTPNVCQPKTPGSASDPHGKNAGQPKAQNPCAPPKNTSPLNLKNKLASNDPKTPATPKANDGPLNLKPSPGATQLASSTPSNSADSAALCESKPPYLPWGGHGSASITVSGGKPCGIGWHDTGATILENITVTSQPKHGSITPKNKNVVIFTPTAGYKGQDKFMLRMQERNGSRRATLTVTVNVTIR
jgi:hypothetical protein